MIPKIPNTPMPATTIKPATQQPGAAEASQRFPEVETTPQAQTAEGAAPAPDDKPANLLHEINKPYAELDKLEQQVLERLRSLEVQPASATDPAALHHQTTDLLWIQMRVSRAALAVQLSAKTIEMTTTGINTLARTQT